MGIKKISLLLGCALASITASAQSNLHVYLKDGTVLNGFFASQTTNVENKTATMETTSAIVVVHTSGDLAKHNVLGNKTFQSVNSYLANVNELSEEWRKWGEEHNAIEGTGSNATMMMSDIVLDGYMARRVRLLEQGERVKYLELSHNTYSFKIEDIAKIEAEPRNKLQISGINRRYKMKNGEVFEGQYVEEIAGRSISLLMDDGVNRVINRNNVMKYNCLGINPDQNVFEQSELLDIIKLKDGSSYKGIIIESNYFEADKKSKEYMLITLENGMTQSIETSMVTEYCKEINPRYAPIVDIDIKPGQILVNGNEVSKRKMKEAGNIIIVDVDSTTTKAITDSKLTVTVAMKVDSQSNTNFSLVRLTKYVDKKSKNSVYGFTYEDLVKNCIIADKTETNSKGTMQISYVVPEEGYYAFYDSSDKTIIPIWVIIQ